MTLEWNGQPAGTEYAVAGTGRYYHVWKTGLIWKAVLIVDGQSIWEKAAADKARAKALCDDDAWERA